MTPKDFALRYCLAHGVNDLFDDNDRYKFIKDADVIYKAVEAYHKKPVKEQEQVELYPVEIITLTGEIYSPSIEDVKAWTEAYPSLDIDAQLKLMAAWCQTNKKNRKTIQGMPRFCNWWLAKNQNRPPKVIINKPEQKTDPIAKKKEALNQKIREHFGGINNYKNKGQTGLIQPLQKEIAKLQTELRELEEQ